MNDLFKFPTPTFFKITSIQTVIGALVNLAFGLAGLICFIFLIWGGIDWMTSGGDSTKTKEARDKITNALYGLTIVAIAAAVVILIGNWTGVSLLDINLPVAYS